MKKTATIILNRNLPEPTNNLVEHLKRYDSRETDIYVVEAGSDTDKLSKYCTWHANTKEEMKHGMRYSRGMNFGLYQLWMSENWCKYDTFLLLTNDTELQNKPSISVLKKTLEKHKRVGLLSPCSINWGERLLLNTQKTKYFWYIHNNAYFLRRQFIEDVMIKNAKNHINFLFDGTNFRGYLSENELIAKGYANDWASAITAEVFAEENQTYLLENPEVIKTDKYEDNIDLYVKEGLQWLRDKYGFNSRWAMHRYVKLFYDSFFEFHPEYNSYKL